MCHAKLENVKESRVARMAGKAIGAYASIGARRNESSLKSLQKTWNRWGKTDPLWFILAQPRKKHNKWDLKDFFATGKKEIEGVMQHVELLNIKVPRGEALDFGCGVGRLTQALAEHFNKVCGVDIAPSMIQEAKKLNKHNDRCEYILNRSCNLEMFSDNTFDMVYTRRVLQHIPPELSRRYIKEFLRVLRLGGLLIFQIPSEPTKTIKGLLTRIFTPYIFRITRHIPYLPLFEMYGIPREHIVSLVETNGGSILDVKPDPENAVCWRNFHYYVVKGKHQKTKQSQISFAEDVSGKNRVAEILSKFLKFNIAGLVGFLLSILTYHFLGANGWLAWLFSNIVGGSTLFILGFWVFTDKHGKSLEEDKKCGKKCL